MNAIDRASILAVAVALACNQPTPQSTDSDDGASSSTGSTSSTGAAGSTGGTVDTGSTGDTGDTGDTGEPPAPACVPGGGSPDDLPEWGGRVARGTGEAGEFVVVVGTQEDGDGDMDVLVETHDADGAVLWSDVYGGAAGLFDRPLGVAVDAGGFIHVLVLETILSVVGENAATLDQRLVVLRYASDGAHVWRWERERPPVEPWQEYTPGGQIAVFGDVVHVLEVAWNEPTVVIRLDRFGNVLSDIPLAAPQWFHTERHDLAPDGGASLASNYEWEGGMHALWVGRFAGDGALLWNDMFGSLDDDPSVVVAGNESDVFFVWTNHGPGDWVHRLRRYDAAGTEMWTATLPLGGIVSEVYAGALTCDGNLLLAGQTAMGEPWLAAYSPDGEQLWAIEPG